MEISPQAPDVIGELEGAARAVLIQHFAFVAPGESRLKSARDVVREQADRTGGRDRGQVAVADAIPRDAILDVFRPVLDEGAFEVVLPVEEGGAS